MSNTFGTQLRFTGFGESHGPAVGGVLDGMPAGIDIDFEAVRAMMRRRRPGASPLTTARKESDEVKFLSGIYKGKTLGTPIAFVIENSDVRSADYEQLGHAYRPNHADYTYQAKYGIRDHRGGCRASARETAGRVVAGALAMQFLASRGISIKAEAEAIGKAASPDSFDAEILAARADADSVGGVVRCVVSGCPAGLGEPVFGKLQAMLASAMMSINAAKGFEYGCGFDGARRRGSELLDTPYTDAEGHVRMASNHSGGIQGGISNGEDIYFRVAFKPVATLMRALDTIDDCGNSIKLEMHGRHDVCVVPRALVVVEAMAALTLADALMMSRK